jgi:type IV pilus assembly protein PilE
MVAQRGVGWRWPLKLDKLITIMTAKNSCIAARIRNGFTLIEVMITVAIVAILAAVALPSYRDYVRRGQLPEAFGSLADYRIKMEQYYQDNRRYGAANCADGANAPAWNTFKAPDGAYFGYSCTLNSEQGFKLTAVGSKGQAVGHEYTLDHNNAKATTKFKGAGSSKGCWLLTGNEC